MAVIRMVYRSPQTRFEIWQVASVEVQLSDRPWPSVMAARYDVAPKTAFQLTVAVEVRQLYSTEMEETVAMAEKNKKSHVIDLLYPDAAKTSIGFLGLVYA